MPSRAKKTLSFFLPGVDPKTLISIHYPPVVEEKFEETLIEDDGYTMPELLHEKTKGVYYFFDSYKNKVKNWPNMWNINQNMTVPLYTNKKCWWHRGPIKTHPLGCPIAYHPHVAEGEKKDAFDRIMKENNLVCETNDFFETEGFFCSFPCVKSYILDMCQKNCGGRYKEACTLLSLLYCKIFGFVIDIPFAGSWKVIDDWCGHLSNDEFTQTFGRLMYEETSNIRRPYMFCSSAYIKEIRT